MKRIIMSIALVAGMSLAAHSAFAQSSSTASVPSTLTATTAPEAPKSATQVVTIAPTATVPPSAVPPSASMPASVPTAPMPAAVAIAPPSHTQAACTGTHCTGAACTQHTSTSMVQHTGTITTQVGHATNMMVAVPNTPSVAPSQVQVQTIEVQSVPSPSQTPEASQPVHGTSVSHQ